HPVTILSTLPSAGLGALLALILMRLELSVIALIGIILLIGIVMKNAIMMIDFALDMQRTQGRPAREAIEEACRLRFRPILMTTMAALLGGVPLAFGGGVGAELRLLPVAPLPQVDFPTIQIVAGLPGASPETMASAVATPLERQFGRIAGVTEMTSTSFLGATTITLQFDLARDINGAARDVQAAI